MAYQSVDKLQKVLADEIFKHTKDPKKAAGRALGTFIEIITYYLLKTWGFNHQTSIERGLAEYGNPAITHNVEFSLHPVIREHVLSIDKGDKTITANAIKRALLKENQFDISQYTNKFVANLLTKQGILRNAFTMSKSDNSYLLCSIKENKYDHDTIELHVYEQLHKPYAIVECKRVGIEEGMSKGPQTIEKAKQGAYVARTTSSLQKIRNEAGELYGIIYKSDESYLMKPYVELMEGVISSNDKELLRRFILTVGVVSNHGNWIKRNKTGSFDFSDENFQKELIVLAQSYDWLLFLTDEGLSEFIENLLLNSEEVYAAVKSAFLSSYTEGKKKNQFTKVQMNINADRILLDFFHNNLTAIEGWFKVISPKNKELVILKSELKELNNKNLERDFIMSAGRNINTLSQSWGTPPKYVKAVKQVFGGTINLDPCSNEYSVVNAEVEYRFPQYDGLKESWNYPTIYVNPPYGIDKEKRTTIKNWLAKCAHAHYEYGSEVLALVPIAANTAHWKRYVFTKAKTICFLYDTRLRFLENGQDVGKGAPMACAMVYWGDNYHKFYEVFIEHGAVVDISNLIGEHIGADRKTLKLFH